jgi:hypothetical protein
VNPSFLLTTIFLVGPNPQVDSRDPQTHVERVAAEIVKAPIPPCQSGHEGGLANGVVTIRAGETICLTLHVEGDSITLVRVVTPSDPKDVLVVKLWEDAHTDDTFLTINNPLSAFIRYEATLLRPGNSQPQHTSTCDVMSRRVGFEQWPYAVSELKLKAFASLPEAKAIECR